MNTNRIVEVIPFTVDELVRQADYHLKQFSHEPESGAVRRYARPNDLIYYLMRYAVEHLEERDKLRARIAELEAALREAQRPSEGPFKGQKHRLTIQKATS